MDTKYKVKLIVGDWSDDGHGETFETIIDSNLSEDDIFKAHIEGQKILGINIASYCKEYQQNLFPKGLIDWYFKNQDMSLYDHGNEMYNLPDGPADYKNIFLAIAKLGNPSFKFKGGIHDISTLRIGGYGLFE